MERNNFDIIIIGSGYRAMVTAYLALKKNKKILIVSKSKDLFGIMSPLKWQGGNFDKGYHFFDGIDEKQKSFLTDFIGSDILHDFGFGAASLTNNRLYSDHAIPYWPHQGKFFCAQAFLKYIINFSNIIDQKINEAESYEDLVNLLPNNIREILIQECKRRIGKEPKELSYLFQDFPFFNFRQTIFPDSISKFLKDKSKYFDETIASRRKSLNLDCISLYPKGQNMGVVAEIMKKKLIDGGVEITNFDELKIFDNEKNNVKIFAEGKFITADKIYIVTELDDALNFFEKKFSDQSTIYYLPQIFYFFSTIKINSKFQYVMGNTVGNLINRANNMSLYGEKTMNNEFVLSAEVADNTNIELWNNPEKYLNKVWEEIKLMGLASIDQKFSKFDIFPIKKTAPLQLINFNKVTKDLKYYLEQNFNNKVLFPGLGKRTSRSFFLDDVEKTINKHE